MTYSLFSVELEGVELIKNRVIIHYSYLPNIGLGMRVPQYSFC